VLDLSQNQSLARFFYHLFGDSLQVVDLQNALDLHQQTVNDSKVPSGNPYNRGQRLLIRKVILEPVPKTMARPSLFVKTN